MVGWLSADTFLQCTQVDVIIGADAIIVKGKNALLVIEQFTITVLIGLADRITAFVIDVELQGGTGLAQILRGAGQVGQQRLVGYHLLPLALGLYVGLGKAYLLAHE